MKYLSKLSPNLIKTLNFTPSNLILLQEALEYLKFNEHDLRSIVENDDEELLSLCLTMVSLAEKMIEHKSGKQIYYQVRNNTKKDSKTV